MKKVIISVCLLLAYSIGLAHELIPHCHLVGLEEKASTKSDDEHQHHHEHHEHEVGEVTDHEDITHEDHLDAGVMDYLLCVLSESEHSSPNEGSCCYLPAKTNDISSIWTAKAKFATLLFGLLNDRIDEDNKTICINFEITGIYLSPPLSSAPHRGPPYTSC